MTWIAAMPGLLTGAAAAADVRITIRGPGANVRTLEGVQKVHYLDPPVVMGFARSIELGFRIVKGFRRYLSGIPNGAMARPGYVTWHFACRLRWAWRHRFQWSEYGSAWPFSVAEGRLRRDAPSAVVFTAGGVEYAVSGTANGTGSARGHRSNLAQRPDDRRREEERRPIIDRGLELCP